MRQIDSRYLDDGKRYNQGQPATLIEVEEPADLDRLYDHIVESEYYDKQYLVHSGYQEGAVPDHFWFVAEIARHLRPRRALEIGCGRGDVLYLLSLAGIEVHGIDLSSDAVHEAWPSLRDRLRCGDILEVLDQHLRERPDVRFDLVCGFDIWEHLRPASLSDYMARVVDAASDDALFFFIVPAFGDDPVFGEQFPLEFEENRPEFERREPFRFLVADASVDTVPALGHLTWAHTEWWQRQFESHGMVRLPALERSFHRFFDPFLPHSVKAFYIFRRGTPEAARRAAKLRPYGAAHWVSTVGRLLLSRTRALGPVTFEPDMRDDVVDWSKQRAVSRLHRLVRRA